ncbi:MAG: hypothetical protein IKD46_00660 [Lentisphaeria bacterium]|nr:hypothetical protein [Lentisphaeria bacterium]
MRHGKKKYFLFSLLMGLCVSIFAGEVRQLVPESPVPVKGEDGGTYLLEDLGNPMVPKESEVEFVTTLKDGSRVVWGVVSSPGRHGVQGVNLQTGEVHWIDTTADFGPHAHRTELAPYGDDVLYIFSGNIFKIYKYTLSTRKKVLLHTFPRWTGRYWIASRAVGPDGKIYVGTYPRTIAIGVDPATDKAFQLPPITKEKNQKYLAAPAVDDRNIMYAPVGRHTPELFSYDLKTGRKKQLLTPEQIRELKAEHLFMPSVFLYQGKVYTTIGGKRYLCTPEGLQNAPQSIPWPEHPDRVKANGRFPSRKIHTGETAVVFGDRSVIVADKKGNRRAIFAKVEGVKHEIYRFGARRGDLLFGSGIFRAKVFSLNLKTLQAVDYGRCTTGPVQSYDLLDTPDGLLISSYTGATLDLFEPDRPRVPGKNPLPVAVLENTHQQERIPRLVPVGDCVYAGTQPIKGHLNGAVLRMDLPTRKISVFRGVIPEQSIPDMVLCPDGKTLFGNGSILGGTGAVPKAKTASVFLWDTVTDKVIWSGTVFPDAIYYTESGLTADGHVITFARNSSLAKQKFYYYMIFDPVRREVIRQGRIPARFSRYLVSHPRAMGLQKRNYFAADGVLYAYDPALKTVVKLFSHPSLELTQDLYVTPEGFAYYLAENTSIIRVKLF